MHCPRCLLFKIREIIEELGDNDFDVFPDDELKYFDLLGARADRLRENSKMLIDGIVHLRDAYQSALDLRLNNTMKLFTIVTVVFAPLGFITGWFGMNFKICLSSIRRTVQALSLRFRLSWQSECLCG